jgi:hypothetical protein
MPLMLRPPSTAEVRVSKSWGRGSGGRAREAGHVSMDATRVAPLARARINAGRWTALPRPVLDLSRLDLSRGGPRARTHQDGARPGRWARPRGPVVRDDPAASGTGTGKTEGDPRAGGQQRSRARDSPPRTPDSPIPGITIVWLLWEV